MRKKRAKEMIFKKYTLGKNVGSGKGTVFGGRGPFKEKKYEKRKNKNGELYNWETNQKLFEKKKEKRLSNANGGGG